jgi:hypothetical protein
MTVMRDSWTDERLDDLKGSVDSGFRRMDDRFADVDSRFAKVDARFAKVDERFDRLDARLDTEFGRLHSRLDSIMRALAFGAIGFSSVVIAALVAVAKL